MLSAGVLPPQWQASLHAPAGPTPGGRVLCWHACIASMAANTAAATCLPRMCQVVRCCKHCLPIGCHRYSTYWHFLRTCAMLCNELYSWLTCTRQPTPAAVQLTQLAAGPLVHLSLSALPHWLQALFVSVLPRCAAWACQCEGSQVLQAVHVLWHPALLAGDSRQGTCCA